MNKLGLQKVRMFGAFQKVEERDDGTLFVAGICSSESVDAAGEVVKADAMKAAIPDFMKFGTGNLREMHQLIAAGTIDKIEVRDDGCTYIESIVVDPIAIAKVKTGVYKGYSIGGNATSRDKVKKSDITGVRLNEISLVDRPCNPDAVITLFKIDNEEDPMSTPADATVIEKAAIDTIAELLNKGTIKAGDLLKAAQAIIEPPAVVVAAEPVIAKAAKLEGDTLKKGMFGLSTFAELLTRVAWLTQDAAWEADIEGDSSKVPQQLREWLAQGATIFSAMTTEEVAELVASVTPAAVMQPIVAADAGGDMGKVATPPAPAVPVVEPAAPVQKVDAVAVDPASVQAPVDDSIAKALAANVALSTDLQKALGAITTLEANLLKATDRIKTLEDQPMPGKALLKAIGKGADVATTESTQDVEPVKKADGTVDDAATLIKAAHQRGGMTLGFK